MNQDKKKGAVKGSTSKALPKDANEKCEEKKDSENDKRDASAEVSGSESSYLRRA